MSRGHDRERLVRELLEVGIGPHGSDPWWVMRAAGSLGDVDLVAARGEIVASKNEPAVAYSHDLILVEVKSTSAGPYAHFSPVDRAELAAAARLSGGEAWLCWCPPTPKGVKGVHGCWIPESEWPQ